MEFASVLRQLASVHEQECNRRRLVQDKLEKVQQELEQLKVKYGELGGVLAVEATCAADNMDKEDKDSMSSKDRVRNTNCTMASVQSSCHRNAHDRLGHMIATEMPQLRQTIYSISTAVSSARTRAPPRTGPGKDPGTPADAKRKSHNEDYEVNHLDLAQEFALMKGWTQYEGGKRRWSRYAPSSQNVSLRGHIKRIVDESIRFDFFVTFAIVANSVVVGISVDHAARRGSQIQNNPRGFKIAERGFTILFLGELIMRLSAGFEYFFRSSNKYWNCFDLIVVGGDIVQLIMEIIFANRGPSFSVLRSLRFIRATRVIRIVRLVRFFKELRMMVYSILRCGTSLLWSVLLFLIIFYIFGVFFMIQVTEFVGGDGSDHAKAGDLSRFFGTIPQSLLTLYACMSGGISWTEVSNALGVIGWSNTVGLALFVFFSIFVVANILNGIFVETAIQSAVTDRDDIIQEQMASRESELNDLRDIFREADTDGSGEISDIEFQAHLAEDTVRAHLNFLGIHVNEAMGLFKLLDQDRSGFVAIDEFVTGCMRLKGGAKGIDLATMMYESKKLAKRIKNLDAFCEEQFHYLRSAHEAVLQSIRTSRGSDDSRPGIDEWPMIAHGCVDFTV